MSNKSSSYGQNDIFYFILLLHTWFTHIFSRLDFVEFIRYKIQFNHSKYVRNILDIFYFLG